MRSVDYQYNELNQLIYREDSQNQEYTYTYDKRGNRVAEAGKKESRAFVYDETNRLVEGTNWKGDKSSYTYNASPATPITGSGCGSTTPRPATAAACTAGTT